MKYLLFLVLVTTFCFVQAESHSSSHLQGIELKPMCLENERISTTQEGDFLHAGVCIGYILGVNDDNEFRAKSLNTKRLFCVPTNQTRHDLVKVVNNYMEKHPEELEYLASYVIARALSKAYPCKE